MAQSILTANDIPYYVHNGGYASLYPGIQMHLFNVPTIMVPPSAAEFAKELLRAYTAEIETYLRPKVERSPWHILRMLIEAFFCVWFVPRIGSSKKALTEPSLSAESGNDS